MPHALILTGFFVGFLATGDDRTTLQAIVTAYESNRSALDASGSIHFAISDGLLPDGVDFQERDLPKFPRTEYFSTPARYLFDNPRRLWDQALSAEALVSQTVRTGPGAGGSPVESFRLMTDGRTVLFDIVNVAEDNKTLIHAPTLVDQISEFFKYPRLPLDFGNPGHRDLTLGSVGKEWLDGQGLWKLQSVDATAVLDGHRVVELTFRHQNEVLTFWVDLERGAIPLRTRFEGLDKVFYYQIDLADIRWVGDRGWFPFQMLSFQPNMKGTPLRPGEGIHYWEYKVTEADFDRTPGREEFAIEFPKKTKISNMKTLIAYPAQQVWGLDDISSAAAERGQYVGGPEGPPGPFMPRELAPRPLGISPLILAGLCLLAIGGLWLFRRRRYR